MLACWLRDEGFGLGMMLWMLLWLVLLVGRSGKMVLEEFLVEFLRMTPEGLIGRKLVVDWVVCPDMGVPDVETGVLVEGVRDADFLL